MKRPLQLVKHYPLAPPMMGTVEEKYASGNLAKRGHKREGKKHGEWRYYFDTKNEKLKAIGEYLMDALAGQWHWYSENGQLIEVGSYLHGVQEGLWTSYYESGTLRERGYYSGGKRVGMWVHYDNEGNKDVKQHKGAPSVEIVLH